MLNLYRFILPIGTHVSEYGFIGPMNGPREFGTWGTDPGTRTQVQGPRPRCPGRGPGPGDPGPGIRTRGPGPGDPDLGPALVGEVWRPCRRTLETSPTLRTALDVKASHTNPAESDGPSSDEKEQWCLLLLTGARI